MSEDDPFADLVPQRLAFPVNAPSQPAPGFAPVPPQSAAPVADDLSFDDLIPTQPMPNVWDAVKAGVSSSIHGLGQTAETMRGGKPVAEDANPAAAPLAWSDLASPGSQLAPKVAYRLAEGAPAMVGGITGAIGGGLAGSAMAPGPGTVVGSLAGGTLGTAAVSAAQTLGPYFAQALKESPDKPEEAYTKALHAAELAGVFGGASWALFPVRAFQGPVKQMMFQAFGVQPAVAVAHKASSNVVEGKPVTEDLGQSYAEGAAMTALPMAGHALATKALGAVTRPGIRVPAFEERVDPVFDSVGSREVQPVADVGAVIEPAEPVVARKELPIVKFRKDAAAIESNLPKVEEGVTRLWRGNRPGEVGQNPSFTNDLAGIALPFRQGYGGELSYVDVLSSSLGQFEAKAGAAPGAEFIVTPEIARAAKIAPLADSVVVKKPRGRKKAADLTVETQAAPVEPVMASEIIPPASGPVPFDYASVPRSTDKIASLRAELDASQPDSWHQMALQEALNIGTNPEIAKNAAQWASANGRNDIIRLIIDKADRQAAKADETRQLYPELDHWARKSREQAAALREANTGTWTEPNTTPLEAIALGRMPQDMLGFIRDRGGIRDTEGELKAIGARDKTGIINNTSGLHPDEMRRILVEQGYLDDVPHEQQTQSTVNDLYDAVGDALNGRKIYRATDADRADMINRTKVKSSEDEKAEASIIMQLKKWHRDAELPYKMTEGDEADIVQRVMDGQSMGGALESQARDWINETHGETNEGGIARGREEFARRSEEGNGFEAEGDPLESGASGSAFGGEDRWRDEAPFSIGRRSPSLDGASRVQDAISRAMHRLPSGVAAKSVRDVADVRGPIGDRAAEWQAKTGRNIDGTYNRDTGDIYIAHHALNPDAVVGHELFHALRERGLISDDDLHIMAHAAEQIPDLWNKSVYEKAYDRANNKSELMAEEAGAHLYQKRIEGYDFGPRVNSILDRIKAFIDRVRNALRGDGFNTSEQVQRAWDEGQDRAASRAVGLRGRTAKDIMDEIDSGHMAQRDQRSDDRTAPNRELDDSLNQNSQSDSPNLMYSMGRDEESSGSREGGSSRSVGAVNVPAVPRSIDNLGYYSHALEAARGLKQAKGTPEQMLAQLRSAGVKQAEIEATGLDKFFAEKQKPQDRSHGVFRGPEPLSPEAGATGTSVHISSASQSPHQGSSRIAISETPEYKHIEGQAVKAFDRDIAENEHKYFKYEYDDHGNTVWDDARDDAFLHQKSAFKTLPALASAINSAARAAGHSLDMAPSTNSGSWYGTLKVAGRPDQKVRLADHGNISSQFDPPVFNINPDRTGMSVDDFLQVLVEQKRPAEKKSPNVVTRDEIASYLEQNRVGVKEARYGLEDQAKLKKELRDAEYEYQTFVANNPGPNYGELRTPVDERGRRFTERLFGDDPRRIADNRIRAANLDEGGRLSDRVREIQNKLSAGSTAKWSEHSLDPSNPTYRETVIHLPSEGSSSVAANLKEKYGTNWMSRATDDEMNKYYAGQKADKAEFTSGHFPEPNIIGHMMTSMTKHEGRPVYTIDQIQSDWGQKLRDGGVRDEAKIAELKATLKAKYAEHNPKLQDWMEFWKSLGDKANGQGGTGFLPNGSAGDTAGLIRGAQNWYDSYNYILTDAQKKDFRAKIMQIEYARRDLQLPESELATAEASASGHPLVNTTDQWTTTTLRRAIRQAAEADAEYIAIPHGDTVLSYNPGKDEGMAGFYGTRTMEGIVPKNLRKLLEKLDKESPRSQRVETLDTPSGKRGWQSGTSNPFDKSQTGFTLFPLTEKVKQAVMDGGLPTFASGGRVPAPSPLPDMPVNKDRAISRALAWIKIGK